MKITAKRVIQLFLLTGVIQFTACKKDTKIDYLKSDLVTFNVNNAVYNSIFNTTEKTVKVIIPHSLDKRSLTFNFSISDQAKVLFNNNPLISGSNNIDCTLPVKLSVSSGDHQSTTLWTINAETDVVYQGLGNKVTAEKSLNKTYDFYIDQFDGSTYQSINCGPAVTTMAIKWSDSTFTKTSLNARNTIRPNGDWWFTNDVSDYLTRNGVANKYIKLDNFEQNIKEAIDDNNALILCLDMYYVSFNADIFKHTDKFYKTAAEKWGHFILVKGYKIVDGKFYLEAYDPYSETSKYTIDGTLKGKNRYYTSTDIKLATDVWWQYAIVVLPKGKTSFSTLNKSSIRNSSVIPVAMGR